MATARTGKRSGHSYVQVQGYRYLRREMTKRFGDEAGKELFETFRGEITSVFNGTLIPKCKEYCPVDTGSLQGGIKVKVLAKKIQVQSGTSREYKKAAVQYWGYKDPRTGRIHKGKKWVARAWGDTHEQVIRELQPVAQRYASMVGRRLNSSVF